MSNSDVIRKYFSACENKDRKAVESLLTGDFVFASPYERHWKLFEKGNEAFILYDCKTKNGSSGTRNSSRSKETR